MAQVSQSKDLALLQEVQGLKNILSVAQLVVSSLELDEVLQNILHRSGRRYGYQDSIEECR